MTRIILLTTAIVTGLVAANGAAAFGGRQGADDRPSFAQIDTDGDGKITSAELDALPAARMADRFKAADSDGDGKISKDELAASIDTARVSRNAQRLDNMFARFDTDQDGAISEAEMTASAGRNKSDQPGARFLSWADADKDGAINEDEYAAVADRAQQRMGREGRMNKGRFDRQNHGGRNGQRDAVPFWRN